MRRHSLDVVSLVFGVLFLALAAWWLIGRYIDIDLPNLDWIAAVALIIIGLLGVVASLRRAGRSHDTEPTTPTLGPSRTGRVAETGEPGAMPAARQPTPTGAQGDAADPAARDRGAP